MEDWTPFLGLAAVVFVIWVFTDHPAFSWYTGERNLYPISCANGEDWFPAVSDSFLHVECPKGSKPNLGVRRTIVAIQIRQIVVERDELGFTHRYEDCVVYDAENWNCNFQGPDQGKRFYMMNGQAVGGPLSYRYVSKATWYWYKWVKQK